MIIKGYFKNFWKIFGVFSAMVTAIVVVWNALIVERYCVQGNLFFRLFSFSGNELCPILISLVAILSIVLGVMVFVLLLSVIVDLIIWPVRVIIRKRKNRVQIIKNPFYE